MPTSSIALVAWLLAASPPAGASPPGREGGAPMDPSAKETRILVVLQPRTSALVQQAVDAASASLRRQDVQLQVVPQTATTTVADKRALAKRHDARGVFWFREDGREIEVFLATPDAVFVRRIEVDPEAAQASVDSTWHIVQSSSSALAIGQRVAMEEVKEEPPAETSATAPEPAAAPRRPGEPPARAEASAARFALCAGYLGESFATAVPWQSGASLGLLVDAGERVRVGIGYGVLAPWRAGDPPVRLRHQITLHAGVHRGFGPRVDLGVRLAGTAELVHWRATQGAESRGVRPIATIGPDATMELSIARGLFAWFALGGSAVINRFAFVECADGPAPCEGDRRRVVLAPWWVRPRAQLGLGFRW